MASDIPDVLARICADTRLETARRKAVTDDLMLRDQALTADKPRGFEAALRRASATGYGVIAEIKQASPSGGLIRHDFDPAALARAYQEGGATCLSVLTDPAWFQGDEGHLRAARQSVSLPILRKDFILDTWQLLESRAMGADCILLIMAALTDHEAQALERDAMALGMDVLVEVHDRAELDRALKLNSPLIGINNRDLRRLVTDIGTTIALAQHVPADRLLISESGIGTAAQVAQLAEVGARCFLVGESLLRQNDVAAAVRALIG